MPCVLQGEEGQSSYSITGDLMGDEGLDSQPGASWSGERQATFPPREGCMCMWLGRWSLLGAVE